jgi:hypothetical protein
VAKTISQISSVNRYVCRDCNEVVFRRKGKQKTVRGETLCAHCGREMIPVRSIASGFALGIGWAGLFILGVEAVARIAPNSKSMTITVGLAICGALACNRIFEGTRYFHGPEPSASISRQTLAEAIGAFLALLIGSGILLR